MAGRTYRIPVLPHWRDSTDVLLKALVASGGDFYRSLESVGGQARKGKNGPVGVWLQYTRVTDAGVEALAGFTEVTEFQSSQRMTDASLVHLRRMTRMRSVQLDRMSVTGDGLRHLAGMSRLERLQICGCTLTDVALSHLPDLPRLGMLNLSSSTGCTDAALESVARLTSLTSLSLNGAPAVGPGLRHLARLTGLSQRDLSSGHERMTTDADLAHLPRLPTVENLSLHDTDVTDAGLAHLARLPAVQSVSLEMTAVTDAGVRHLAALPKLEWVNLNHTKVTLRGVRELQAARPGLGVSAQGSAAEELAEPEPAVLIRRPDARAAAPVAESWARIEAWFAVHLPAALATLRPPAAEADLAALERRIGRPLPADFRASYRIHDGQSCHAEGAYGLGVLFGRAIEPIAEGEGVAWLYEYRVEREWGELDNGMRDWEFYPPDAMRESWGGPGWLPFYWDIGRNFIGLDLDPGPNGVAGQVIPFGTDDRFRPVLALSFAHLLEDIADELEAGSAIVRPPELTDSVFDLRGGFRYKEWAGAKLPLAFRQARAAPRVVPEDHATPVSAELAAEVVGVLRAFLTEMNEYERRWLAVRPIHEYGVFDLGEWPDGITSYSMTGMLPGEEPRNAVQRVLWDPKAMEEERREALGQGQHYQAAVAEKRAIRRRYLTAGKRPTDAGFHQQVPPYYDPAALTNPDVRQVAPGHVIVTHGEPRPPGTCGGTGRLRWHLRLERERWRVERHESVDDPAKPWKLDLP